MEEPTVTATPPPMSMAERGQQPTKPGRKRGQNREGSAAVRERLLRGDVLTRGQVEKEYNVANGFLLQQVRWLERQGHEFETVRVDGLPGGVKAFKLKTRASGASAGAPLPRGPMPTADHLPPVLDGVSKRQQISEALLDGHKITSQLVKDHWDTDPTMLKKAVRAVEADGIEVKVMKAGAQKVYYVEPGAMQRRAREAASAASSTALVPIGLGDDDDEMALTPYEVGLSAPHLGQELTVFLTAMDDDGEVMIGLRNGTGGSWQVQMLGFAPAEADAD